MQKTIDELEEDSDNIKEHFPVNPDYDTTEEEENNASSARSTTILGTNKFG